MKSNVALEVREIVKTFPGTKALDHVRIELEKGEIHAVVGENGAGKTTLMKVIDGIHQPDKGEILINGQVVQIDSPHDAQKFGIGFVHQEIALCQHMTVAENIYMSEISSQQGQIINFRSYERRARELLKEFKANIDPRSKISALSISNQQIVEILKALSLNCTIIIFDEPTAALTESETETLFNIIRRLKEQGISILYISHRMAEIFNNCDRVTILRDGHYIDTLIVKETTKQTVVNKMVGRDISDLYPNKTAALNRDEPILRVKNLGSETRFEEINFALYPNEILGIAGLVGAGRSEVVKAICGLYPKTAGEIYINGKPANIKSYQDAINHGLVYLTEDRKEEGLFLSLTVQQNIAAINLDKLGAGVLIDRRRERGQAKKYTDELKIRCSGLQQEINSLSGGNQQKVLLGKLLAIEPKILFMDEPTRGIDVGAKSEIHLLLRELADRGIGIVMISSELPEVIGMCDRVIVMHEGRISGVVTEENLSERTLIHLASGITDTHSTKQGAL